MTIGEAGQRFGQPFIRVDGIELAALDQCGNHRPIIAAFIRAGEERVFAVEGERPDAALDGVAIEVDTPVVDEALETIPPGDRIADRLAEFAFGADLAVAGVEVLAKIVDDHPAALGAHGSTLLG